MDENEVVVGRLTAGHLCSLIWLFNEPLSAARMGPVFDSVTNVLTGTDDGFSGSVEMSAVKREQSVSVNLRVKVINTNMLLIADDFGPLTAMLVSDGKVIATAKFQRETRIIPAVAYLRADVLSIEDLYGARIVLADEGRFCFEHTHCETCGVQAPNPVPASWAEELDETAWGSIPRFCPECQAATITLTTEAFMDALSDAATGATSLDPVGLTDFDVPKDIGPIADYLAAPFPAKPVHDA